MATKETILLLTDFTNRAKRAADLALQLAITNNKNLLIYNSVVIMQSDIEIEKRKSAVNEVSVEAGRSIKNLNMLTDYLKSKMSLQQIADTKITYREGMGSVTTTILNLAMDYSIWMVVMGYHIEADIATIYFDSNVPSVMNNCSCPVLLVP